MEAIGEFRYAGHYFKIYSDGEIYVDYKSLGKVYPDGEIWIARKRMGKIYEDGEIWLSNEKVGRLTPDKELWVNGKRVATGIGRTSEAKRTKPQTKSTTQTYKKPSTAAKSAGVYCAGSGVGILTFFVTFCMALATLYATSEVFLHGGLLGSTYGQYAGQSKLIDLLIYGIPAGFFALVTAIQTAGNQSFGVALIEHAVSEFLEMCIFSWVTGYPLVGGPESVGFYILAVLALLIAALAPAAVSTVIKRVIYWFRN